MFSGTVATFVDPAGSEPIGDYTATIAWGGAGSGSTTGTIVSDGSGNFHVTGSFTYAEEGTTPCRSPSPRRQRCGYDHGQQVTPSRPPRRDAAT